MKIHVQAEEAEECCFAKVNGALTWTCIDPKQQRK